jgi:uncharacterized cofD-like protein
MSPSTTPLASQIKAVGLAGGTGGFGLARSLSRNDNLFLTMIVPVSDEGGSSRRLLDSSLVTLPPGDAAQAVAAMARGQEELISLLPFRLMGDSPLSKHSIANLLIAGLEQKYGGDFKAALDALCHICGVRGRVLPVSQRVRLGIERQGGQITIGEDEIDEQRDDQLPPIIRIFHQPTAELDPDAAQAIAEADVVIVGPGSFATSVGSILATNGMTQALARSHAKIIGVANLANEAGHTSGWTAHDYGAHYQKMLAPAKLDVLIVNSGRPPAEVLQRYQAEGEELVEVGEQTGDYQTIEADMLASTAFTQSANDAVKRSLLRHDTYMLQSVIMLAMRRLGIY